MYTAIMKENKKVFEKGFFLLLTMDLEILKMYHLIRDKCFAPRTKQFQFVFAACGDEIINLGIVYFISDRHRGLSLHILLYFIFLIYFCHIMLVSAAFLHSENVRWMKLIG